jgi:hypothetical protein
MMPGSLFGTALRPAPVCPEETLAAASLERAEDHLPKISHSVVTPCGVMI